MSPEVFGFAVAGIRFKTFGAISVGLFRVGAAIVGFKFAAVFTAAACAGADFTTVAAFVGAGDPVLATIGLAKTGLLNSGFCAEFANFFAALDASVLGGWFAKGLSGTFDGGSGAIGLSIAAMRLRSKCYDDDAAPLRPCSSTPLTLQTYLPGPS